MHVSQSRNLHFHQSFFINSTSTVNSCAVHISFKLVKYEFHLGLVNFELSIILRVDITRRSINRDYSKYISCIPRNVYPI